MVRLYQGLASFQTQPDMINEHLFLLILIMLILVCFGFLYKICSLAVGSCLFKAKATFTCLGISCGITCCLLDKTEMRVRKTNMV